MHHQTFLKNDFISLNIEDMIFLFLEKKKSTFFNMRAVDLLDIWFFRSVRNLFLLILMSFTITVCLVFIQNHRWQLYVLFFSKGM